MLLWQHKICYSSSYECSQFSKCNSSFQALIHRMINKGRWKFFCSHQTQFPILDLKELLGHCKNKVHWSFNPSQTYYELSKTAPSPDILQQVSEPCLFLAQRLGLQKIENPNRASFQQFLILPVACLVSTVRTSLLQRQHSALHSFYTREHLPFRIPKSHTDTAACRKKYPFFYIGSVKQVKYIVLKFKKTVKNTLLSTLAISVSTSEKYSYAYDEQRLKSLQVRKIQKMIQRAQKGLLEVEN